MLTKSKIFLTLASAFLFLSLVETSSALVYIDENWDTGTPAADWPCKSPCNTDYFGRWFSEYTGYCGDYPSWETVGLSTERSSSGTRSFKFTHAPGVSESCDIDTDIPEAPTAMYVRFNLWLDGSWVNFNTPSNREPSYHFMFTNTAQSGTGFRVDLLSRVPYSSPADCSAQPEGNVQAGHPYMFFNPSDGPRAWPVGSPANCYNLLDHLDEWQCVEFYMNATTDNFKIWIDDNLLYDTTYYVGDQGGDEPNRFPDFHWLMLSNYFSSEDGSSFATSHYMDDLVVSDSYVGCGGGTGADSIPPAAPSGLSVL